MKTLSTTELERELIALQSMKTPELQMKWRDVFKSDPPRKMRAGFLQRAIAYRLQELTFGGLKPKTKRELQRLALALKKRGPDAEPISARNGTASLRRTLSPGTQLLREWNGRTELVDVTQDGFVWRAQTYRTLSAVAVAITGTKWSGPKFFGLSTNPTGKSASNRQRSTSHSETSELEEMGS